MKKILLCLILVLCSCSNDDCQGPVTENIPISVLHLGKGNLPNNAPAMPQFQVITNHDDLTTFRNNLSTEQYIGVPVLVDFDTQVVIAVVDGHGGSYHRTIDITHVYETTDQVVVTIEELFMGGAQAAVSTPYHFASIPKPTKPIVFDDKRN